MLASEESIRVLEILAPTIKTNRQFEMKLASAPAELKALIYEVCAPRLSFKPKPLSWYIMRAGIRAEQEQLPTLDSKGEVVQFSPAKDAATIDYANELMAMQVSKRRLTLTCGKCGTQHHFYAMEGETPNGTVRRARLRGWVYDYKSDPVRELCPECAD